jgi:hypothetical protein
MIDLYQRYKLSSNNTTINTGLNDFTTPALLALYYYMSHLIKKITRVSFIKTYVQWRHIYLMITTETLLGK